MNTHEITLDVSKEPSHEPTLYLGQGDMNGTTLVVNMFDNGEVLDLTGLSVKFCMRTPNMLEFYEVAGTASGNVATFAIDETYAAGHPGSTDIAYVQVIDGDTESTSTARMRVVVLPSAKEGVDPAPAYKPLIDEFIEENQEAVDEIIEAAQEVLDDGIPLMASTRRGGAMLGDGLKIDDGKLSLALGETSSTAYRGDRGAAAYAHAVTNKGAAFSSNLYKITTNSEGHVTAATPATSADIVAFLNNQAITPSSVTASGTIKGGTISDGVGTLAQLRDSVAPLVSSNNWINNVNLNDYKSSGSWSYSSVVNAPMSGNGTLIVLKLSSDRTLQLSFTQGSNHAYYRHLIGGDWSSWYSLS